MPPAFSALITYLVSPVRSHASVYLENIALRHQLTVYTYCISRRKSDEGKRQYGRRAGVEGAISQGARAFGMRRSRYRGLDKTHLQNVAIAAAMNVDRLVAWFDGYPRAQMRTSRFAALMPHQAVGPG